MDRAQVDERIRGLIAPFIGIKLIDIVISALGLA